MIKKRTLFDCESISSDEGYPSYDALQDDPFHINTSYHVICDTHNDFIHCVGNLKQDEVTLCIMVITPSSESPCDVFRCCMPLDRLYLLYHMKTVLQRTSIPLESDKEYIFPIIHIQVKTSTKKISFFKKDIVSIVDIACASMPNSANKQDMMNWLVDYTNHKHHLFDD